MDDESGANRPAEAGYLRIGELARRTGVSPELLRAWERRYGLLQPSRSQGGFRLYTAADEARIHRMKEHLAHGLSAAEAARLAAGGGTPRALAQAPPGGVQAPGPDAGTTSLLRASARDLAAALDRFDEGRAHIVLDRLLAAYRIETILRDLLLPYLHELGERWARGEISVAQEHFASNLLRGRLLGLARGWGQSNGPTAILACPPGEQHDLGLLAFGITLQRQGWRIIYLGPDTPIATIRDVAAGAAPRLVVLASTTPGPLAADVGAIVDLAHQTPVALGGAGATAELAARVGARLLDQDAVSAAESLDRVSPAN
jgi:MerR family transcriptional regulator, light-induced transcriptional regulator